MLDIPTTQESQISYIPAGENTPFIQIYPQSWSYFKDLIKNDEDFGQKSKALESLFFLMENVDYRTGEIEIKPKILQEYLDTSKSTAYAVIKFLKEKGIISRKGSKHSSLYIMENNCIKLLDRGASKNKGDYYAGLKRAKRNRKAVADSAPQVDWNRYFRDPGYARHVDAGYKPPPKNEKGDAATSPSKSHTKRSSSMFPNPIGDVLKKQVSTNLEEISQ